MSVLKVDQLQSRTGTNIISPNKIVYPGAVLQVVQYQRTPTMGSASALLSTSSTSWSNIMTMSITPQYTTSKILVRANFTGYATNGTSNGHTRVTRNGTMIDYMRYTSLYNINGAFTSSVYEILDSPASVSTVVYAVQGAWINGTTCYWGYGDSGGSDAAALTLMEIAQ